MTEEKTQEGCGCGAGASCCSSPPEPVKTEPKEPCCGGAAPAGDDKKESCCGDTAPADAAVKQESCCGGDAKPDIREAACCDPVAGSPEASKIRKVGFVLLLLFAGVVLIHGLLTKDADKGAAGTTETGEVRN